MRNLSVQDDRDPIDVVLSWIARGLLLACSDGSVWRMRSVSKAGAVVDLKPPRRADRMGTGGYRRVMVTENYRQVSVTAHRLVWTIHNGRIPDGMLVNHIDGDRGNNDPLNLELVTPAGNTTHAHRIGNYARRKRRTSAELESRIRSLRAGGASFRKIESLTGVSHSWCRQFLKKHGPSGPTEAKYEPFVFVA